MKEDADVNSLLPMSALEPGAPRRGLADVNFSSSMLAIAADAPVEATLMSTLLRCLLMLSMPLSMSAIDSSMSTSLLAMSAL